MRSVRKLPLLFTLFLAACGGGQVPSDNARLDADVGDLALNAGTPEVTLRLTEESLANHPDDADALTRRGQAFTELGRLDEARQVLRRAVSGQPNNVRTLLALGRVLLPVDPAGAAGDFETALKQDDRNAAALNDLGIARDLLGRHDDAAAAFRSALAARPDLMAAKVNLALCLAMAGQGKQAISLLQPLADAPDATRKIKDNYAAVLAMAGKREQAERILSTELAANEVGPALDQLASARTTPAPLVLGSAPPAAPPSIILASTQVTGDPPVATRHRAVVQLAALDSEAAAYEMWDRLSKRMPDLLNERQPAFSSTERGGHIFWRVRTAEFANVTEARTFCERVRTQGSACIALMS